MGRGKRVKVESKVKVNKNLFKGRIRKYSGRAVDVKTRSL